MGEIWRSFRSGFASAVQLFLILTFGVLMLPLFLLGMAWGFVRITFLAGMMHTDDLMDWLSGSASAWRVTVAFTKEDQE